ncbi:MAG TPA: hypothetical protein DG414_06170 [Gammaproteobacteria bacterium]|jgi:hypothetical protein|nr:hypothetical protein [Arenicellales bacterium]HCY13408.1 hypothetical protein [Gammaproteobacteria bacterium]|tara:strand:- start:2619 stop:2903 length:285 start_codon:yes stop_codon:yes gene_type:complete
MAVYRITRFTSSNMDKAVEGAEAARSAIEALGADFIDLVSDGEGNGIVIAKYPDTATMEAATATAQQVFGQMIQEGAMDGASIDIWSGDVVSTL